jgi:UDP-glucose 4-epimerase
VRRILITGGCGFIGSALHQHFLAQGIQPFVIDDFSYGSRSFIQTDAEHLIEANILDRRAMHDILGRIRPTEVLHLAAVHFIPHCNQYPYESANINLAGTINVLDAARDCGSVEKVLFASTAAVYPIIDGPIAETDLLGPLDVYGMSKMVGERLCSEFHLASGTPVIVCRFFNAFGPNETNPHLIPEIQRQLLAGERTLRLGNLEPKRDFIHTSDMARAISVLLDRHTGGFEIYNLGSGSEYSVTEIVDAFARCLGEEIAIEVDPARVRKTDRLHLLANVSKLKAATGWRPLVTLDEGIRTLVSEAPTCRS